MAKKSIECRNSNFVKLNESEISRHRLLRFVCLGVVGLAFNPMFNVIHYIDGLSATKFISSHAGDSKSEKIGGKFLCTGVLS